MLFIHAFLLLTLVHVSISALVKWIPNKSFNLPRNFKGNNLPCSKKTVVFPESSSVRIDADTELAEIILPVNGEIDINGMIILGADDNDNCTDGKIYYMDDSESAWAQPDVWSSSRFNKATPDKERRPCYDDRVEFPQDAQFSVTLPDATQVIQELRVGGKSLSTGDVFRLIYDYNPNTVQSFIRNKEWTTGLKIQITQCKSRGGCPCQILTLDINCFEKFCEPAKCSYPVKPVGNCCNICGGFIIFETDQSFEMDEFTDFVDKTVKSYGEGSLAYHIGKISQTAVQLVIVENGEYSGTSAEAVNYVNNVIEERTGVSRLKESLFSGNPISKSGLGGKIFVSGFFIGLLVMIGMYAYAYMLPKLRIPMNGTAEEIFSRFQRRTDSVVSLTRRDSTISGVGTAFRNPLYDSKRGRVHVVESDDKEE